MHHTSWNHRTLWQNYLEPQYRERAIRIERDAEGIETIMIDNDILLKGRLAALGGAEHDAVQTFTDPELTYMDGCPKASMILTRESNYWMNGE